MCANNTFSCSAVSRVTTEPINTSAPPEAYLVNACIDRSTAAPSPRLNALSATPAPHVLSSALSTSRWRAARARARRSGNSIVIEPGASSHTSLVRSPISALNAATFIGSYSLCVMPQSANSVRAISLLGPYTLSGSSTSSPPRSSATLIIAIAARPLGASAQCVPPSRVASRSSSVNVVGVPCSPYV